MSIPTLSSDTWDYRLDSSGGNEYLKEIAFNISSDASGILTAGTDEAEIFFSLGLINNHQQANSSSATGTKYALRWELWKDVSGSDESVMHYSVSGGSWDSNILDLSGTSSQASILFPNAETVRLNSEVENFTLRLYSVKFDASAGDGDSNLTSQLSNITPGDTYAAVQAVKNYVGYLGGFRVIFTYSSDLQSYTVQMVTINAEDLVEQSVNIADFFSYHAVQDKNAATPNTAIFTTTDIMNSDLSGEILRSQLTQNLGLISYDGSDSNMVFRMDNVDSRIRENAEYNHTTFGDVYGTTTSRYSVTNWRTELTLINSDVTGVSGDTDYMFDLSGNLSSELAALAIGQDIAGNGGYHWEWTPGNGSVEYDSGSLGLSIVSPNIDLSGTDLSSWSVGDRLDFFARSNFGMFFNHTFTLTYSNATRSVQSLNISVSRNLQSGRVTGQETLKVFRYPDSMMNTFESNVLTLAHRTYSNSTVIFAMLIILVVMRLK